MSEPGAVAQSMVRVAPQLQRWWVADDRIGGMESDSHVLESKHGPIFIDPLPLTQVAADRYPGVAAVCLTAACHQRSSWRYRRELGARVWAPRRARTLEQDPDRWYDEDDKLPGDLRPLHTPGPEESHFALLREAEPAYLFVGDLITRPDPEERRLEFVPPQLHTNPEATRRSVERLLDFDFSVLCMAHGAPITDDPRGALAELLDRTA